MPTQALDPFALLGVTPESSRQEIHAAWRLLMRHAHPDAGGSHEYAAALNWAHDTLLDPQARFDFVIRHIAAASSTSAPRSERPPYTPPTPPPRPPRSTPPPTPPPPAPAPVPDAGATRGSRLRTFVIAALLLALAAGAVPAYNALVQAPAVTSTAPLAQAGLQRIPLAETWQAVPGAGYGADECQAPVSKGGRWSPDPSCSPGVLLNGASRAAVCSGGLPQRRPERMARWAAKQSVLRAYGAQPVNAPAVALVIPQALGGAWHIDNLWAGRTTATRAVIDEAIDLMCAPDSAITYREVLAAAQDNSLDRLVRNTTDIRTRQSRQPAKPNR